MWKHIKEIIFYKDPIKYLNPFDIQDKSNKELFHLLENEILSRGSGNMIIIELLKRALKEK